MIEVKSASGQRTAYWSYIIAQASRDVKTAFPGFFFLFPCFFHLETVFRFSFQRTSRGALDFLGGIRLKLLSPVKRFFYYYRLLEVNVYAAYAAYFILLSVFPAIMLLIAILQQTSIAARELEILIKGVVPASLSGLVEYMVKELFTGNSLAVLSLSAVMALWLSSKGVYSLHRGLNKVYNQGITRNSLIVRLECTLFTLLLLAAMVLTVALQMLRKDILISMEAQGWRVTDFFYRLLAFRLPISFLVLMLLFTGLYCVFPHRKERFLDSLPGAASAAALWIGFTRLFTVYIEKFTNYSVYYGSLSTIAMAMLWLYVCMLILFCGGMLNCAIKVSAQERKERREAEEKQEDAP